MSNGMAKLNMAVMLSLPERVNANDDDIAVHLEFTLFSVQLVKLIYMTLLYSMLYCTCEVSVYESGNVKALVVNAATSIT